MGEQVNWKSTALWDVKKIDTTASLGDLYMLVVLQRIDARSHSPRSALEKKKSNRTGNENGERNTTRTHTHTRTRVSHQLRMAPFSGDSIGVAHKHFPAPFVGELHKLRQKQRYPRVFATSVV